MPWYDSLIQEGAVPAGTRPKTIQADGSAKYESNGIIPKMAKGLQTYDEAYADHIKQRDEKNKRDAEMYTVLRDAGYDSKSAFDAVQKGDFPSVAGGTTLKEKQTEKTGSDDLYRANKEARLQRQNDITNLKTFGGTVSEEQLKTMGIDLEAYVKAGGGQSYRDESGKQQYRIMPFETFQQNVAQGKWAPTEIEKFRTYIIENQRWTDVLGGLAEMGIGEQNLDKLGKIEFDPVETPFGTFSIPARFSVAAQYLQDPRYTAVARKIELAFQAFRQRVTGANAAEKELRTLRVIVPSLRDRPQAFFTTVRSMMDENQKEMLEQKKMYEAFGRDTAGLDQLLQQQTQPNPLIGEPLATPATAGPTPEQKQAYNAARAQGKSKEDARKAAGF